MSFLEIFLIAVSLAMDALAVSISNGLMLQKIKLKHAFAHGAFFGVFQFFMPVIGFWGASLFSKYIQAFDHWIAFILLLFIGGNMIKESFDTDDEGNSIVKSEKEIMSFKNLTLLAIATSIDALAVGVTFAMEGVSADFDLSLNIWISSLIIGVIAFVLSFAGVIVGKKIGSLFQSYAERVGGAVLICIGLKILISALFFGQ
jgi:putative Mn2+ efflux pump MntP